MRIHLPLPASFFNETSKPSSDAPPIVQLGGELVLMELQGEIQVEGERAGGVVGVLGFERKDKPTLHIGAHHLLHGKIATLQKPYAVIRKVLTNRTESVIRAGPGTSPLQTKVPIALDSEDDGGESEDENVGEEEEDQDPMVTPAKAGPSHETPRSAIPSRLLPPASSPTAHLASSSPPGPPSQARDYSSDLDSSPVTGNGKGKRKWTHAPDEVDDEETTPTARRVRSRGKEKKERTRAYEVVGVIRKKIVFSLRPEPIVTATVLPE